ncbi:MAG: hypothetical protein OEO77_11375 [Acidimicrobiia bacterium]|nr:hypothetical protein [Acidimicrobiia bacterium]
MKYLILITSIVLIGACSGSAPATPTSPVTASSVARSVDLTDPAVAADLGSPPFAPVAWQRFIGPWTAVGDGAVPGPNELALMQAAATDLPAALSIEPRQIVRTSSVTVPEGHPATGAVAASRGPDIYLLDGVFAGARMAPRLDILLALSHELVHVAQWYELDPDYITAALDGRVQTLRLVDGSTLVEEWAAATGWTDTDPDPFVADWTLVGDSRPPTAYARTDPAEDMADSVSMAVIGRGDELDDARRIWVEQWLGTDLDTVAAGQPWAPAGAASVTSEAALYDTDAVLSLMADRSRIDQVAFELPGEFGDLEATAALVEEGLARHGLVGSLTGDDTLRSGRFDRQDGSTLRVEVRDLRASGATGLLLVYVLIW